MTAREQVIEEFLELVKQHFSESDNASVRMTVDPRHAPCDVRYHIWARGELRGGNTLEEALEAAKELLTPTAKLRKAAELRAQADQLEAMAKAL